MHPKAIVPTVALSEGPTNEDTAFTARAKPDSKAGCEDWDGSASFASCG